MPFDAAAATKAVAATATKAVEQADPWKDTFDVTFGAIGAAVGILGAVLAILAARDARRSRVEQRQEREVQREEAKQQAAAQRQETALQHAETQHQATIALEGMLGDHHSAIRAWADESLDWMSQAHSLTFYDPARMPDGTFFNRRAECLWHLSSLADRGRLFFPNDEPDKYGDHKEVAYRGFAPVVIDYIKSVHALLGELHSNNPEKPPRPPRPPRELRELIVTCKRGFTSEVQAAIEPRARETRMRNIMASASSEKGQRQPQ